MIKPLPGLVGPNPFDTFSGFSGGGNTGGGYVYSGPNTAASIEQSLEPTVTSSISLGIDCVSFSFSKSSANWQEAKVKNIKFNVVFSDAARSDVRVTVDRPIWFGFPVRYGNGQLVSEGQAATDAANAAERAADRLFDFYKRVPVVVMKYVLEQKFLDFIKEEMILKGGRADFYGSGSPSIITNEANYDLFGNGDCL